MTIEETFLAMTRDGIGLSAHQEKLVRELINSQLEAERELRADWNVIIEDLQKIKEAAIGYRQALKDHSKDPCQCPPPCSGYCGPANAGKLLLCLGVYGT